MGGPRIAAQRGESAMMRGWGRTLGRTAAWCFGAAAAVTVLCWTTPASAQEVSFATLMRELVDRGSLAREASPAFVSVQRSSTDPASKTPSEAGTWFANGDANNFIRMETNTEAGTPAEGRREWVMLDERGPGAVVRIWSANPRGTLRVYVDGQSTPVIEGAMAALLTGAGAIAGVKVPPPLAHAAGRGCSFYLPIPYAQACKITTDVEGVYYHVQARRYAAGTRVETFDAATPTQEQLATAAAELERSWPTPASGGEVPVAKIGAELLTAKTVLATTDDELGGRTRWQAAGDELAIALAQATRRAQEGEFTASRDSAEGAFTLSSKTSTLAPGATITLAAWTEKGNSGAIVEVVLAIQADVDASATKSLVITGEFDGVRTVLAPVGGFFGCGHGLNPSRDRFRSVTSDGVLRARWVMPYEKAGTISVGNFGQSAVRVGLGLVSTASAWTPGSMHFHAGWRGETEISTIGGQGTRDWNFITIEGTGVYVADTLSVSNESPLWWGEGDEKISIDGEAFPSHFGTGTDHYYGIAWCSTALFGNPFHAQARADGKERNNWGWTTMSRVRPLDVIPFEKSLKFDLEVWHWDTTRMSYESTAFWYARGGVRSNAENSPEKVGATARQPTPLPTPFMMTLPGGVVHEAETLKQQSSAAGIGGVVQVMSGFKPSAWSNDEHLFVNTRKIGDSITLRVPAGGAAAAGAAAGAGGGAARLMLFATKSWDFAIVRVFVNDAPAGGDIDLSSGQLSRCEPTGPIDLGVHTPINGEFLVRVEVAGSNPRAAVPRTYFGIDAIGVTPVK
jgi:hypothetical protein